MIMIFKYTMLYTIKIKKNTKGRIIINKGSEREKHLQNTKRINKLYLIKDGKAQEKDIQQTERCRNYKFIIRYGERGKFTGSIAYSLEFWRK